MSVGPLVTDIVVAFVLAAAILYRYGNWYRHHIIVTLAVLIAWYFSFLIIFVLPLDVSSAVYRACRQRLSLTPGDSESIPSNGTTPAVNDTCLPPWSYVPDSTFPIFWRVVYWSSQFLTWIVMPLMQSYTQAGDFTVTGKLRSAAIDNAIYYGTYLFIAGILLVYLATKPHVELDWPKLKAIASSASNTWGLFLLVLLLGHALVEVPRGLWNNSKPGYSLEFSYFRVAKLNGEKCEAEETVDDLLDSLQAFVNAVSPGHPQHEHVDAIFQKIPVELREKMARRQSEGGNNISVQEKALVRLHKQLIKALQTLKRTEAQWTIIVNRVFLLEDIEKNRLNLNRRFKPSFNIQRNSFINFVWTPTIEWYYRCVFHKWILRFLALVTAVLSIAVVWSEATFFNEKPVLSLFAVLLNVFIGRYDYYAMELISTAIIGYLCYCAYSTVLQIKFLNKYYIAPNHQTDEFSLIFSGMMLSRLTPPMCLNFLGLIHMDNHIIKTRFLETAYTQIMGHMDVLSIISDGFNIYFPMLLLIFCLAAYFSLGRRLLSIMGFQQFMADDEFTVDVVEEGKELIKREKRRRQRLEETESRRREFEQFRGRERTTNESDRGRSNRSRDDSMDSARAVLLADTDHIDYYVQHPRPSDENRDRVGRLPKGYFDDV